MTQIRDYVFTKSKQNEGLHNKLKELLAAGSKKEVGLILSERFINMPVETAPPMWRMLLEEVKWAVDEVRQKGEDEGIGMYAEKVKLLVRLCRYRVTNLLNSYCGKFF